MSSATRDRGEITGTLDGLVFNIQRFSLQDGPGIRTTVFLKGCPLRCRWCCNPDSQNPLPEPLHRAQRCKRCKTCAGVCAMSAISFDEGTPRIDRTLCNACAECARVCPGGALEIIGKRMGAEEVVQEVCRDEPFYRNSGGGVTLSGGEPLFQPEFCEDLLRRCQERGLHTCLDTSGYAPWDTLTRLLDHTDLVLFDLKHTDARAHVEGTGVGNALILDNLEQLTSSRRARVWVRVPVIPGFNDSESFFEELAAVLEKRGVEKGSLLGYHEWGRAKYAALGRQYTLDAVRPCPRESLERFGDLLRARGLDVTINH